MKGAIIHLNFAIYLLFSKNYPELVVFSNNIPFHDHLVPLHPPGDAALHPSNHLFLGVKNTIVKSNRES